MGLCNHRSRGDRTSISVWCSHVSATPAYGNQVRTHCQVTTAPEKKRKKAKKTAHRSGLSLDNRGPHKCWAAPIDARLVSDFRSNIGLVDQERCTCTDVELRRQHHIRCKTPLDEFFARAALAQRVVQSRLHSPKCCQCHQGFWRPRAV